MTGRLTAWQAAALELSSGFTARDRTNLAEKLQLEEQVEWLTKQLAERAALRPPTPIVIQCRHRQLADELERIAERVGEVHRYENVQLVSQNLRELARKLRTP